MSRSYYQQILDKLDLLVKSRFIEMFGHIDDSNHGWPICTWNELLSIKNGKDYKDVLKENGPYPIYGSGGEMGRANEYLTDANSVIIGRKGSINTPILMKEPFWNIDTAFGITPNQEILDVNYLYHFMKMFNFMSLNKQTALPSLVKGDLLKIKMNVPPIGLQNEFADFVKQVDKSKFIAKQCLEKYDLLVKSRFIEMFGSREDYVERWTLDQLCDHCDILYGYPFNSKLFNNVREGTPLIRIRDILKGYSETYTTEDADQTYIIKAGDIVVGMDGDFCASTWKSENAFLNQRTCKIKGKSYLINDIFLLHFLGPELSHIHSTTPSTTVKHLSAKMINEMKMPIPPIESQNEFADFVKQVDKSKFSADEKY